MRTLSRAIVLAAVGSLAAVGAAHWVVTGEAAAALPGFGSKDGIAPAPSVAPTYGDLSKDFQNRPISSPGMGLNEPPTPSVWKRMGSSIAKVPGRVAGAAKTVGSKTKAALTPNPTPAVAAAAPMGKPQATEAGPDLFVASAVVYERSGNYTAAAQQYEKALAIAPNHLPTLLSYGHMLDRQGNLEQACALYERAIKSHPKEAATYNDLGLCLARRGMLNDAAKIVAKAVQLQPDRALYRNNLAAIYVEQRRPEEAFEQLKATQSEAIACYNVGYLLVQRGQDAVAGTYFNRALQAEPTFADARAWSERLAAGRATQPPVTDPRQDRGVAQVASLPSLPITAVRPTTYVPPSNWEVPPSGLTNGEPVRTGVHSLPPTTIR